MDEGAIILIKNLCLVIAFVHQVSQLLFQRMEKDGVLVDVSQKILTRGHAVGIETDFAVFVVKVQHRVQRVVILCAVQAVIKHSVLQNLSSPSFTRAMSVSVPASSNR